jgi:hypothetical protein
MKPLRFSGLLAAAVTAALWLKPDPGPPHDNSAPLPQTSSRPALPAVHGLNVSRPAPAEAPAPALPDRQILSGWRQRLTELRAAQPDAIEAHEQIAAEIDHQYHSWLLAEIRVLAELPPRDRHDLLADLEQSVTEGAAAIVEHLAIAGAPPTTVLADSLEVLAAEIQYAEMAPTPEARLALLRLDQERQARLTAWAAASDANPAGPEVPPELEAWYDQEMAGIVAMTDKPANPSDSSMAAVAR